MAYITRTAPLSIDDVRRACAVLEAANVFDDAVPVLFLHRREFRFWYGEDAPAEARTREQFEWKGGMAVLLD